MSECGCSSCVCRPRRSTTYLASLDRTNEWILTSALQPSECCGNENRGCCDCQTSGDESEDELSLEVYDTKCGMNRCPSMNNQQVDCRCCSPKYESYQPWQCLDNNHGYCCRSKPQPCVSCNPCTGDNSESLFIKLILPEKETVESESEPEACVFDNEPCCAKVEKPWKTYFITLFFFLIVLLMSYYAWKHRKKKRRRCKDKFFNTFCLG